MIHWQNIVWFRPGEFQDPLVPDSGNLIDGVTLLKLHELRVNTGWPIITHWPAGGCVDVDGSHGHAENSYHLQKNGCKAVDFHFATKAPAKVQIHEVMKAGFTGTGIYGWWKWNGVLLAVGFHVDTRPVEKTAIWSSWKKGEYIYV